MPAEGENFHKTQVSVLAKVGDSHETQVSVLAKGGDSQSTGQCTS